MREISRDKLDEPLILCNTDEAMEINVFKQGD